MAYKRYPPAKVPVNIWEFRSDGETAEDDLVKITLENGQCLFVAWRSHPDTRCDATWRVDRTLLPQELDEVKRRNGQPWSSFSIPRSSGFIGRQLQVDMTPASNWRLAVLFTTSSLVRSIRPARRPRISQTLSLSGETEVTASSDYH